MLKKPELLSPVGSYEALRAAVSSGADAVYLGGKQYSARAYSNNFELNELLNAIDYCHIYSVKVYLTINTLLKNSEIDQLYNFLLPLYQQGLDAVIVQDIGVLYYIRNIFPKLEIHASTQMNIHHLEGVKFLQELGVKRVVLSRELTLCEIKKIKEKTVMGIECFIHGALCYCYSGQCLMSSIIGGRSGNRGKCAQPCRLPYKLKKNGKINNSIQKKYLLSPKDICTLELLPDLLDTSIDSLKIEGRMKRPEYVAGVTSIYRKHIDYYFQKNNLDKKEIQKDKSILLELFNRGEFSKSYYVGKKQQDMMATDVPKNKGVPIGRISKVSNSHIFIQLYKSVYKGDVLEVFTNNINAKFYVTSNSTQNTIIKYNRKEKNNINKDALVFRTFNQQLTEKLQQQYVKNDKKILIKGFLSAKIGKPISLKIKYKEIDIKIQEDLVEQAKNQPTKKERIIEQLNKTGNSYFKFKSLFIEMDENVFIPIQVINKLRRNALQKLMNSLLSLYRRKPIENICYKKNYQDTKEVKIDAQELSIKVSFTRIEDAILFVNVKEIDTLYVEVYPKDKQKMLKLINLCMQFKKNIYLILPHIFRDHIVNDYIPWLNELETSYLKGYVVRNYEQYKVIKLTEKDIILDYNVYVINNYAIKQWQNLGVNNFTLSPELNYKDIEHLPLEHYDIIAYGYLPLMISDQCINNTIGECSSNTNVEQYRQLIDRYNKTFLVKNNCYYCYNIIYNSSPTILLDQLPRLLQYGAKNIKLSFSFEKKEEIKHIIDTFIYAIKNNNYKQELKFKSFNRGHLIRGIK